jgi:hypothetical protein
MNVIALTQFAFLTLGIVFLKIMIQANSDYQVSRYLQTLNRIALWLFASFKQTRGRLKNAVIRIASGKMSKADFAALQENCLNPINETASHPLCGLVLEPCLVASYGSRVP